MGLLEVVIAKYRTTQMCKLHAAWEGFECCVCVVIKPQTI